MNYPEPTKLVREFVIEKGKPMPAIVLEEFDFLEEVSIDRASNDYLRITHTILRYQYAQGGGLL